MAWNCFGTDSALRSARGAAPTAIRRPQTCDNTKVYDGVGTVERSNMIYAGFSDGDDCPGGLKFNRKSATDEKALKLAD